MAKKKSTGTTSKKKNSSATKKKNSKKITTQSSSKKRTTSKKVTTRQKTKGNLTSEKIKEQENLKIKNEKPLKQETAKETKINEPKTKSLSKEKTTNKKNSISKNIVTKQESVEDIMKRVDEVTRTRKRNQTTNSNLSRDRKNKDILEKEKINTDNEILEKVNTETISTNIEPSLKTKDIKKRKNTKEKTILINQEHKVLDKIEIIKEEKQKKNKIINKVLIIIIYLILISIFIFAGYKCINWFKDNKKIEKQVKEINEIIEIEETPDNENIEVIEQPEDNKTGQYWNYLNMKLINVNFQELKNQNSDTVGWIQVNGTNINYPFVQTTNNDYYLTHAFDKTYNDAGWVFLDYRNNIKDLHKNTIIYAHSRLDHSMFGTLKNVLHTEWINNPDNFIIKLSMESENTMWQVFSVYHIPTTSDYLQIDFYDNSEFLEFGNMLLNRSAYNFNTSISENDKILTLSTCYSDTEKTVLHAKLIKREVKE